VHHAGLGFRKAQPHRGQYLRDLFAQRFNVLLAAVDQDSEIVRLCRFWDYADWSA
jgi:hypothetical protein